MLSPTTPDSRLLTSFAFISLPYKKIFMKKLLLAFFVYAIALSISSCKKCFHCYNACTLCAITVSSHTFTETFCVDSFNTTAEYNAAIAHDTSIGYACAATTPSYSYDFCVNQPGEEQYPNYFNKGKRATCDEK